MLLVALLSPTLRAPQLRGSGPFPFRLDGPSPQDELLLVLGFFTPAILITHCLSCF